MGICSAYHGEGGGKMISGEEECFWSEFVADNPSRFKISFLSIFLLVSFFCLLLFFDDYMDCKAVSIFYFMIHWFFRKPYIWCSQRKLFLILYGISEMLFLVWFWVPEKISLFFPLSFLLLIYLCSTAQLMNFWVL